MADRWESWSLTAAWGPKWRVQRPTGARKSLVKQLQSLPARAPGKRQKRRTAPKGMSDRERPDGNFLDMLRQNLGSRVVIVFGTAAAHECGT